MKTIHKRGLGFDRPSLYDEITIDLKVHQGENVFQQIENQEYLMSETEHIKPVVKKILQSMKAQEVTSTVVKPEYVEKLDPDFKNRHPEYDASQPLLVDLELKNLCRVTDLYHDMKVFYKSVQKGEGTQSPYNDCRCALRVKIEVDGEVKVDQFKIGVV